MCGRARLSSDLSEIKLVFPIPPERPAPNIAPSWNVAPTDPLPIVHYGAREAARSLDVMRRGLIPYWAKDTKIGFSTINARAEEVDTKPAFLAGKRKDPRFTIVTTTPNELCAELHACGAEAGGVANVAWRRTGRRRASEGAACLLPFR
jgi:putative SOS response-associated peptidase YedK